MGMPGLTPAGVLPCLKLWVGQVQGVRSCGDDGGSQKGLVTLPDLALNVENEPGVVWPVDLCWGLLERQSAQEEMAQMLWMQAGCKAKNSVSVLGP